MISSVLFLICGVALASGGEPEVNCPAPRSPDHSQAFLYQDGSVVKFVCEPGYTILGKEIVRCLEGNWEEQFPICIQMSGEEAIPELVTPPSPLTPRRPLFQWGDEEEAEKNNNATAEEEGEETPLGDEARLRMVLYPRRRARVVTSRVRAARLQSASELEEEERKRSGGSATTTVHLQGPPSVIYVKRTVSPGKSDSQEKTLNEQYRAASVHLTVDNSDANDDQVQVVALPRAAVAQNDKGENYLRNMYWWAHNYYPRQASSLIDYSTGHPLVVTLSDSQIAWINSLHPELRDQYLKDMYVLRAEEAVEGARAQAFLRRYDDAYSYYYNNVYLRQPMAHLHQDVTAIYDYSCNQAGSYFVTAPKLPNAHIARYDRRQNPNEPRNHYLSAVYRCNPGYSMVDTRFTELYCSKRRWIGPQPVCAPH